MKHLVWYLLGLCITTSACTQQNSGTQQELVWFDAFNQTTIRAMALGEENTAWMGGPSGFYAFTQDGGAHWETGKIPEADGLDFRSIALLDENTVLLLTAGSPALIFKTQDRGKTWDKVYENRDSLVFFNSMDFSDSKRGVAFGDVNEGCFHVLITEDAGETWNRIPCAQLPVPLRNEVAFASSNTCIDTWKDHIWVGTGGESARLLHSPDFGETWETFSTPMVQGNTMTGIYSIDFYNDTLGIVAGGDYENQSSRQGNKALTIDGGTSWRRLADGQDPPYISCVQFAEAGEGARIYAAGQGGLYRSQDGGDSWENLVEGDLTTLRESRSGDYIWFAGKGMAGKIKIK